MKLPETVMLAGNPITIEKQTNNMYLEPGRKSILFINFQSGGAIPNNSWLEMAFAEKTIKIVFNVNPNTFNFEYFYTESITPTWVTNFCNFLIKIPDIKLNYKIRQYGNNVIYFESIERHEDYSFTPATNIEAITFNVTPGVTPVIRENFRINCLAITSDGAIAGHEVISPDLNGKVIFDISNYLWTEIDNRRGQLLGFSWPAKVRKIFAHPAQSVSYSLLIAEEWEGKIRPGNHYPGFIALMGGQSELQRKNVGSFYNDHILKGKFLTQSPRTKTTGIKSPERLYYFNNVTQTIFLKATKFYVDGAEETVTLDNRPATAGVVYEIDCSFGNFRAGEVQIEYYEIWLENSDSVAISEKFTFQVDHRYYDNNQYFIFRNSLGGYDCLTCTGRNIKNLDFDREIFEDEKKMRKTFLNLAETKFKVNTGSISTEMMRWLDDLLLSREVWWLNFFHPLSIIIKNNKKEDVDDIQRRFNLTFEFSLSSLETFYTAPQQAGATQPNFNTDA